MLPEIQNTIGGRRLTEQSNEVRSRVLILPHPSGAALPPHSWWTSSALIRVVWITRHRFRGCCDRNGERGIPVGGPGRNNLAAFRPGPHKNLMLSGNQNVPEQQPGYQSSPDEPHPSRILAPQRQSLREFAATKSSSILRPLLQGELSKPPVGWAGA